MILTKQHTRKHEHPQTKPQTTLLDSNHHSATPTGHARFRHSTTTQKTEQLDTAQNNANRCPRTRNTISTNPRNRTHSTTSTSKKLERHRPPRHTPKQRYHQNTMQKPVGNPNQPANRKNSTDSLPPLRHNRKHPRRLILPQICQTMDIPTSSHHTNNPMANRRLPLPPPIYEETENKDLTT